MSLHSLTKGEALVIVCPQGSGKPSLAGEIAAQYGDFAEMKVGQLTDRHKLSDALLKHPKTLILQGTPKRNDTLHTLKNLLSNNQIITTTRDGQSIEVQTPHVIIWSNDIEAKWMAESRRFRVVYPQ